MQSEDEFEKHIFIVEDFLRLNLLSFCRQVNVCQQAQTCLHRFL